MRNKKSMFIMSFALASFLVVGGTAFASPSQGNEGMGMMNGNGDGMMNMMNGNGMSSMMDNMMGEGMGEMMESMNTPEGQEMLESCQNVTSSDEAVEDTEA